MKRVTHTFHREARWATEAEAQAALCEDWVALDAATAAADADPANFEPVAPFRKEATYRGVPVQHATFDC